VSISATSSSGFGGTRRTGTRHIARTDRVRRGRGCGHPRDVNQPLGKSQCVPDVLLREKLLVHRCAQRPNIDVCRSDPVRVSVSVGESGGHIRAPYGERRAPFPLEPRSGDGAARHGTSIRLVFSLLFLTFNF